MTGDVNASNAARSTQAGVSLVEVLTVVAVVGILAALALPSFQEQFSRSRMRSAGEQLRADLNLARSEAVKRDRNVVMSFKLNPDTSWCYGMHLLTACDCAVTDVTNTNYCFLDRDAGNVPVAAVVTSTDFRNITFDAVPFGGQLTFSSVRPSLAASSATLISTDSDARIRLVVSGLGRVRFCSPSSSLSGYPAC